MRSNDRLPTYAGAGGLLLLVAGVALTWWGVTSDHPAASVPGILLAVAGLVGLRVRAWIRKERVLRRLGELTPFETSGREDRSPGPPTPRPPG